MLPLLLALLMAGEDPELTLRWLVADGFYLEDPPSVISVDPPKGIRLEPAIFSTQGRVMGEMVQRARIKVRQGVRDGSYSLKASADLYYCSLIEQQCWPEKRALIWVLEVARGSAKPLEVEIHIPEK